jgi:hypothetical protein
MNRKFRGDRTRSSSVKAYDSKLRSQIKDVKDEINKLSYKQ